MKKKRILENDENKDIAMLKEFGKRVREIRKDLHFSQRQFAKDLGISGSFLSEIESGKTKPGYDFFWNINNKFNVDLYYLLNGTGEPYIIPEDQKPVRKIFNGDDSVTIEKMIGHFKDAPVVRLAVLQFYRTFIFEKKDLIEAEIKDSKKDNRETGV
ncbi:MAG: helix-turn-helix transcriptional regulator [bacterium]|nr:helix-turn-helix transcriptional regulator [bacterium]